MLVRADLPLSLLVLCCALMSVQLIILTVEIAALKRELFRLVKMVNSLNHAVNPWAAEDEPTEPNARGGSNAPPKVRRRRSFWISLRKRT